MTITPINATQPWEILTYCNTVTGGWFGIFTLLIILLAAYMSLTGRTTGTRAFAASMFLTECLAVIFFFTGVVSVGVVYLGVALVIASIVFLGSENR